MAKRDHTVNVFYIMLIVLTVGSCKKNTVYQRQAPTGISLLQVLNNNFQYSIFLEVLKKTGLISLLDGSRAYTILVPDNAAFANWKVSTNEQVDSIIHSDSAYYKQLFAYHFLSGKVYYGDVPDAVDNQYKSITNQILYFSEAPGASPNDPPPALHINGITVKQTDVNATDGVIQVISQPLYLPDTSVMSFLDHHSLYSMFTYALRKFGLYSQLSSSGPWTVFAPTDSAFKVNGITIDSINVDDSSHYYKYLWSIYLLSPNRLFTSDFSDLYVGYTTVYFYPSIALVYNGQLYAQRPQFYDLFDGNQNVGNFASIIDADHIALNGVVQGIDNLIVPLDSARKSK